MGDCMPNWCDNKLIISGPSSERERFKSFAKSDAVSQINIDGQDGRILDFEKFVPYPEKFAKADAEHY